MDDESTGFENSPVRAWPRTSGSLEESAVSGDRYAPTLASSGTRATGASPQLAVRAVRHRPTTPPVSPKARQTARVLFASCVEGLKRAVENEEAFFLRNNSLEHVKDTLSGLWAMRSRREEPFAEVVNMLQAVFLGRDVESFSNAQLRVLQDVFEELVATEELDDKAADSLTLELIQGGIDVFRELA